MLKAIQILSSSSGFVAYRWKPHPTNGFILVSSSLSYSMPSKPTSTISPFSTSNPTPPSRSISAYSVRANSKMDGVAPASPSSAGVKSAVSFFSASGFYISAFPFNSSCLVELIWGLRWLCAI